MDNPKTKIFLSYAHVDKGKAKQIYQDLKRYGLDVWFDDESLLAGQDWKRQIEIAIKECDYFIALISSAVLSHSGFIHSELRYSFKILDEYYPESKIFLIPARLNDCNPSRAHEKLGKFQWVDLFPDAQYKNGIDDILKVVSPGTFIFSDNPGTLSSADVNEMLKKHDYYDRDRNPTGRGVKHEYVEKVIKGNKVIVDNTTSLMWQKEGSGDSMNWSKATEYIQNLNSEKFASFNDWRLPTLEEAMSLMEPEEKNEDIYVDPIFDKTQRYIWTSDQVQDYERRRWVVGFPNGLCFDSNFYSSVRAVRSSQSSG